MTVREWFRVMRGEAWRNGVPEVTVYLQSGSPTESVGPLSKPIRLCYVHEYGTFIDDQAKFFRPDLIRSNPYGTFSFSVKDITK